MPPELKVPNREEIVQERQRRTEIVQILIKDVMDLKTEILMVMDRLSGKLKEDDDPKIRKMFRGVTDLHASLNSLTNKLIINEKDAAAKYSLTSNDSLEDFDGRMNKYIDTISQARRELKKLTETTDSALGVVPVKTRETRSPQEIYDQTLDRTRKLANKAGTVLDKINELIVDIEKKLATAKKKKDSGEVENLEGEIANYRKARDFLDKNTTAIMRFAFGEAEDGRGLLDVITKRLRNRDAAMLVIANEQNKKLDNFEAILKGVAKNYMN
ncbi:MAG: hypothetical protein V1492_01160 [Candidatus Micrarchaeota archaeon]